MCLKEIGLCAQNTITILDSTITLFGRDQNDPFHEHGNLHLDNEQDIHVSYNLDLDLPWGGRSIVKLNNHMRTLYM